MFAVLVGLGILTMALFPFALPGLLLFVVPPLILVLAVGVALAVPLVLPLWLFRTLTRSSARVGPTPHRVAVNSPPRART
jgi:hypothetical protein